ncbi:MAG: hypothetical protein R2751_18965 [Bacteroidales bacterium]
MRQVHGRGPHRERIRGRALGEGAPGSPCRVYRQYKDVGLLEEHYDAMVAYVDYLDGTLDPNTGITSDGQLGDWLGPQNNLLGTPFLTTAYHVFDLWIMKNVAGILGKEADEARFEPCTGNGATSSTNLCGRGRRTLGLVGGGRGFGPGRRRRPIQTGRHPDVLRRGPGPGSLPGRGHARHGRLPGRSGGTAESG